MVFDIYFIQIKKLFAKIEIKKTLSVEKVFSLLV